MKKIYQFAKENAWLILILIIAGCTRLIGLSQHPNGTYTDESYGAFIAKGLLDYGMDDRGYRFPIYFVAWGSGMNALYPYLGMLFFRLLGTNLLAYRLPQALFGIIGIFTLYIICKELFDKKLALLVAFVLTISPWHIMMCRFGLESNLAPNMFLIGLMFLILGLKSNHAHLIFSAFFLGLTLYCYALTWTLIPLFFLFCILLCYKWIPKDKITLVFIVILFIMALPLLLFLAINFDLLPEICTSYFSIPKLTGFRGGELSLKNIRHGISWFLTYILIEQGDRKELLSSLTTGSYYFFTTPLMIFGFLHHIVRLTKNYKHGKNSLSAIFPVWLICSSMISIIHNDLTMIHMNMIHVPIIFYGAYGVYHLAKFLHNKILYYCFVAFWAVSFFFFLPNYFGSESGYFYNELPYEAVTRAREIAGEERDITFFGFSTYKFTNFLWHEQFDMKDYAENAIFDDNDYYVELLQYRNYHYITDNTLDDITNYDSIYILYKNRMNDFHQLGFQVEQVNDTYAIAAMNIPEQLNR